MLPGERVQVVNLSSGSRIETYLIRGEPGSGTVCLNGPAARTGLPGDRVIVLAYAAVDEAEAADVRPVVVFLDAGNRIKEIRKP